MRSPDPADHALPAATLLAAFVGTGSSFLAFAVLAERRGLTSDDYPRKGIFYLGGLTEATETLVCFVLMCLWPQHFALVGLRLRVDVRHDHRHPARRRVARFR